MLLEHDKNNRLINTQLGTVQSFQYFSSHTIFLVTSCNRNCTGMTEKRDREPDMFGDLEMRPTLPRLYLVGCV